jgi:hypothetical protein
MLSSNSYQSIRPLKRAWSFDFHFPILASVRASDRHPPVSWFVAECVLDAGDNFLAHLSISKVLQFDCNSHRAILSKRSGAELSGANRSKLRQTGESTVSSNDSFTISVDKKRSEKNRRRRSTNRKGRDIGYAPAICSCERANSVDTCTVAALDVIAAFAVPNPNCSSQSQSVFSGLPTNSVIRVCSDLRHNDVGDTFGKRRNG